MISYNLLIILYIIYNQNVSLPISMIIFSDLIFSLYHSSVRPHNKVISAGNTWCPITVKMYENYFFNKKNEFCIVWLAKKFINVNSNNSTYNIHIFLTTWDHCHMLIGLEFASTQLKGLPIWTMGQYERCSL